MVSSWSALNPCTCLDLSKKLWKTITNLQLTYRQAEEVDDIRFENEEQRKKKNQLKRVWKFTRYTLPFALILVVWLTCYSNGFNQ